jgi:hypothetical protein
MADVSERLRSRGFGVFIVPEAATLLFTGGATFTGATTAQISVFQQSLLRTQMALEDNFFRIASASTKPSVLLCDRGAMDGKAYMASAEWNTMLHANNWDPVSLRDERYDLVIHMVSAADGAVPFYQVDNNTARTESVEEACAVDKRTQNAWVGHPHLRIVDNRTAFREKIDRVFSCIGKLVGVHDISKSREIRKLVLVAVFALVLYPCTAVLMSRAHGTNWDCGVLLSCIFVMAIRVCVRPSSREGSWLPSTCGRMRSTTPRWQT